MIRRLLVDCRVPPLDELILQTSLEVLVRERAEGRRDDDTARRRRQRQGLRRDHLRFNGALERDGRTSGRRNERIDWYKRFTSVLDTTLGTGSPS
ncbi:hypothetical protein [Streptomyces sp. NPDC055036]